MSKTRFNYWKLTALCLAAAISFAQGVSAKRTISSSAAPFDEPNLSSEARTVDSFGDDLVTYDRKRVELSKKSSLTNEEFNALQRTGDDLKRRVSQVRDAVQSIVRKLKSAGRWDNLDEELLAKVTSTQDRAFLRDNGGLRHVFEDAVTQLDSQAGDELVAPLSQLRSKIVAQAQEFNFEQLSGLNWRMVAATYNPTTYEPPASPVPLLKRSVKCVGATVRYGVGLIVHGIGNVPKGTVQKYTCNCYQTDCPGDSVD